ncbi:MAG TPA: hydrolase [Desulfomonilaceae bacterium]|nr:hydrolase [Desulfomonilaceae bacterium]
MDMYESSLNFLDGEYESMCALLLRWADVNTGSRNLAGLERLLELLRSEFEALGGESRLVALPSCAIPDETGEVADIELGKALVISKRPESALQVLLCCHMDTVYPADHVFQKCFQPSDEVLNGPGVTDAKGGIVVLFKALQALERTPYAARIGWQVLINPDEEIGSPGSRVLLEQAARKNHVGLVFEPSFPDGSLVAARKGSGNFTVTVRGKAAHAGREPHLGRNAINALAEFVVRLNELSLSEGTTVNVGYVHGGGPVNVVPDRAVLRFNVRIARPADQAFMEESIRKIADEVGSTEGIAIRLLGGFARPPKPLDEPTVGLLKHFANCAGTLGMDLGWSDSGGACDGNLLAVHGLPTVDSLGVTGGNIHSPNEYVLLRSLPQRAKLTALFLMKLASGEIAAPAL